MKIWIIITLSYDPYVRDKFVSVLGFCVTSLASGLLPYLMWHPQVWNHFLTCTDEKQWKTGKRRAEKDELVGANFFMALKVPDKPLAQGQM